MHMWACVCICWCTVCVHAHVWVGESHYRTKIASACLTGSGKAAVAPASRSLTWSSGLLLVQCCSDRRLRASPASVWALRLQQGGHTWIGLARTIYIRCTYGIFSLEITKYTVCIYVYIYIYGSGQPYTWSLGFSNFVTLLQCCHFHSLWIVVSHIS